MERIKAPIKPNTIQAKGDTIGDRSESSVKQQSSKTGLLNTLKAGVEKLSGYSLEQVRVHYNSPKPAQLQALAYTQGTEIHLAPGQEEHLPHEMWHVVQQAQGRVQPTDQLNGVDINNDEALECEAEQMGRLALSSASAFDTSTIQTMPFNSSPLARSHFARSIVQRVGGEKSGYNPDAIAKESFRTAVKELFDLAREVNKIRKQIATRKNEVKLEALSKDERGKQVKGAYAEEISAINLDAKWLSRILTQPDVIEAILKDALALKDASDKPIISDEKATTIRNKIAELKQKVSVKLDSNEILDETWKPEEGGTKPVAKILTGDALYIIKTGRDEASGVFRDIYKKLGKSDGEHNEYVLDDLGKRTRRFAYMEKSYYQWMSFKEKGFLTGKTQNFMGATLGTSSDAIDPTDFKSQFLTNDEEAITKKLVTPTDTPENRKVALAYMHQWKGSGPGQRGLSLASTDKENAIFGNAGESFRTEDGAKFKIDLAKTNPADNILINHYSVDSGTRSKLDQGDKDTANRILGEQGKRGKRGKVYQYERSVLKNREIFLRNLKPEAVVSIALHTDNANIKHDSVLFNNQKKAAIDSLRASKETKAWKAKLEQDLVQAKERKSAAQQLGKVASEKKAFAEKQRNGFNPNYKKSTWRKDFKEKMTDYQYWNRYAIYWSNEVIRQTELLKEADADIASLSAQISVCDNNINYFQSLKTKSDDLGEDAKRGWATGELYWQGYEAGLKVVEGKKFTTKEAIKEIFKRAYEDGAKKAEAKEKGETYVEKYDAYWEGYGNALKTALVK
ncbi:DUF4157 domain-containing protein [Cyanobacteria bacterium FACHB-63]|nr:DUF4157 domain-containing protein [Cyanobacteria bacterium FACHB-63]